MNKSDIKWNTKTIRRQQFRSGKGSGFFTDIFLGALGIMVTSWNNKARRSLCKVLAVLPCEKYQDLDKAIPWIGLRNRSYVAEVTIALSRHWLTIILAHISTLSHTLQPNIQPCSNWDKVGLQWPSTLR